MSKITIMDGSEVPHPEDNAMLQALYSRSPASVEQHMEKVRRVGSGGFVSKFLVGYGHKSIGDCGTTTIFIEGVSMLAAKAIQDWPLYNGQEASTRYMDFSKSTFHNPLGSKKGNKIQERWRAFYLKAQQPVRAHLRKKYPRQDGEDKKVYDRAINARSFDILRSFLPAGASTNLSWHTNLRQAHDHLLWLRQHPEPSIAEVGNSVLRELKEKYRNSFNYRDDMGDSWRSLVLRNNHFLYPDDINSEVNITAPFSQKDIQDKDIVMLLERQKGWEVPRFFDEMGMLKSEFELDFGSYRDVQRHRNGIIRMPVLTTQMGFNDWYLDELPDAVRSEALALLERQEEEIQELDGDAFVKQNYVAMGYQVPVRITQGLSGFIYRIELRSSKTVHPTLRRAIHTEIRAFRSIFPDIPIYVDEDPDSWTIRRGKQTITEK